MTQPSDAPKPLHRRTGFYWCTTALGVLAFALFSRSWQDARHLVYDLVASVPVFSFLSGVLADAVARQIDSRWWSRVSVVAPLCIVPCGRQFLRWPISGHLTDALIVAIMQTANPRLPRWVKALYWAPIPVILHIRWFAFDRGLHGQTYAALATALLSVLVAMGVKRAADSRGR